MLSGRRKLRKLILWTSIWGASGLVTACFQTPFSTDVTVSVAGDGAASVITTTVQAGRAVGTFDPTASFAQQLSATEGAISGASAIFPPGALAIPIEIAIESGESLVQGSALVDLGISLSNAVESSGAAVIIRPAENVKLLQPMAVTLPLPEGFGLVQMLLTDDDRLAILAKVFGEDGALKSQLIPRKSFTVTGGKAVVETIVFGAFQTIVLDEPVTEAKEAPTTEPITNKNGVTVITTSGVVAKETIEATETLSPLTFKSLSASFNATTRRVMIRGELSDTKAPMRACRARIRDIARPTYVVFSGEKEGNPFADANEIEGPPISANISGTLELQVACDSTDGRVAKSDWIALGTVARGDLSFTRFNVNFVRSFRILKVDAQISDASASITTCALNVRDAADPARILHTFTKGTAASAQTPDMLPHDISGTLEVGATCDFKDGQKATSSWVSIGNVAAGVNGNLQAAEIEMNSLRLMWTIPAGTSPATEYRVERAPAIDPFEQNNAQQITVIQDWASLPGSVVSTGSTMVTGLVANTSYAFRVAAREGSTGTTRYYPAMVVMTPANSGGGNGGGTTTGGAVGGTTGGGNNDTQPPTIGDYATVPRISRGKVTLRTGFAYDNQTMVPDLEWKLVYSPSAIQDIAGFNAVPSTRVLVDWSKSVAYDIEISRRNQEQAEFMHYTLAVRDVAGNVSLNPSLKIKIPDDNDQAIQSIDFWAYPAWARKRIPFMGAYISNGAVERSVSYELTVGEKPDTTELIDTANAITGTEPLDAQQFLPILRDAPLLNSKIIEPRRHYYATLVLRDANNTVLVRMYTGIYGSNPSVVYAFDNDAMNTGETAYPGQVAPFPGQAQGILFETTQKLFGSHSAKFSDQPSIAVPALHLPAVSQNMGTNGVTGFTMGGWVFNAASGLVANTAFFGFNGFIQVGLNQQAKLSAYLHALGRNITTAQPLPLNEWNHVALSGWAGGTDSSGNPYEGHIVLFINGLPVASESLPSTATRFDQGASSSNFLTIGGNVWGPSDMKFNGFMENVFFNYGGASEKMIGNLASSLNCEPGELLVGFELHAGDIIDRLAIRCSTYAGGPSYTGSAVGGAGGNATTYDCPQGKNLVAIKAGIGSGFYGADILHNIKVKCGTYPTGSSPEYSQLFGANSALNAPVEFTCPAGTLARGIRILPSQQGDYAGTVLGLNCSQ